jgi:hypothetical protein
MGTCGRLESLHYLFGRRDSALFCQTLTTVLTLARGRAAEQLQLILYTVSTDHITPTFFDQLCELIPQFPVVIVLAALVAFWIPGACERICAILGEMGDADVIEVVKVKHWYTWLVLATLRLDGDLQTDGVRSIHRLYQIDRLYSTFDGIMCLIDAIELCQAFETQSFACQFLHMVCDVECAAVNPHDVVLLVQRCFRFLFFSFRPSSNLFRYFQHSPFPFHPQEPLRPLRLDVEKPFMFLAKCIRQAFQMEWDLFFSAEVCADGSGFLRKALFDSVASVIQTRHLKVPDEFSYSHVLTYFRKRSTFTEAEKIDWLKHFNTDLFRISSVMAILYKQAFRTVLDRMLASIEQACWASETAMKEISSEIVTLSGDELEKLSQMLANEEAMMALEWNLYTTDFMGIDSLWQGKGAPRKPSFAVSQGLTQPFVKFAHPPLPRIRAIRPSQPVLRFQAMLVKTLAAMRCTVFVEKDRVVIEEPKKTRELRFNEIKFVSRKRTRSVSSLLEFVTVEGRVILLDCGVKFVDEFIHSLGTVGLKLSNTDTELQQLIADWQHCRISVFRYLTWLNHLRGRSTRNHEFCPIFPLPIISRRVRNFVTHPANCLFETATWVCVFPLFSRDRSRASTELALDKRSTAELSGAFFSAFEYFAGLDMPSFCKDEFELVYFLRGVLESDAVADSLHLWVSQIFHCGVPRGPRHANLEPVCVALPEFRIGTYGNDAFNIVQGDGTVLAISAHDPPRVWRFQMQISDIVVRDDCMTVFDRHTSMMNCSLNGGDLFKEVTLDFSISRLFDCGDLICIITAANEIVVLRPPIVVVRFKLRIERPISLFASLEYRRIVVGTETGALLFYSLRGTKLPIRAAVEPWIPQMILITHGFGFVVVSGFGMIAVFTINGTKIREQEFDGVIERWSAFSNRRGFDFILIATEDGRVTVLEAFTLKQSPLTFQCRPVTAVLTYNLTYEAFAVAVPGTGQLVPWDAVETLPNLD